MTPPGIDPASLAPRAPGPHRCGKTLGMSRSPLTTGRLRSTLLLTVFLAIGAVLFWPIRVLLRKRRKSTPAGTVARDKAS